MIEPRRGERRRPVMKSSQHVVPNLRGGWSVRRSGAVRASRLFDTQEQAVEYARTVAKKERAELYIHRRDGTISRKDSYGADPLPPRDRR
jgi:hypothetical protein